MIYTLSNDIYFKCFVFEFLSLTDKGFSFLHKPYGVITDNKVKNNFIEISPTIS